MATKTVPKPQVVKPVVRVNLTSQTATVASLQAEILEMKLMLLQLQFALKIYANNAENDMTIKRKWALLNQVSSNIANVPSRWNDNWLKS